MYNEKINHECGVFGIYDPNENVASTIYYGLMALQHRGEQSAGIAVNEGLDTTYIKENGLVDDIFNEEKLNRLKGNMGVGHVRHSIENNNDPENAQPLVLRYIKGNLAIAHNGALRNKDELKLEYERQGAIYQTTSDTEIIAYTIARQRVTSGSIEEAVNRAMKIMKGAYSLIVMSPRKLIAARDPHGFRPLCMGRRGNAIIFASESCALNAIDAEFIRDIEPGEIVIVEKSKQITMDGKDSYEFDIHTIRDNIDPNIKTSLCFFEHIYIARPDSCLDGQFVNEARTDAGRFLAQQAPVSADAVVGVPDSGLGAAYGYSLESGIPLVTGFIKNRYIGRTFISPSHTARERLVKIKLNPVANNIRGKRIVMVEDSIVRGTTFGRVVKLLRECGATEVHLRIAAPPFKNECYFGADIPDREQLIANRFTVEDIRKIIGADTLEYLSYENLLKTAGNSTCGFCHGCFSGVYPIN